jgi:hypothetical protein
MNQEMHQKVKTTHLKRNAYLYVRQSTLRQVFENSESTKRQYALRQRAVALGWPEDRIIVLDSDLGQSGASAADREGFQRLVTEVSLGRAGIVLRTTVSGVTMIRTCFHCDQNRRTATQTSLARRSSFGRGCRRFRTASC